MARRIAALAVVSLLAKYLAARVALRELLEHVPRAVLRAVVDRDDLYFDRKLDGQHASRETVDRPTFVIRPESAPKVWPSSDDFRGVVPSRDLAANCYGANDGMAVPPANLPRRT